MLAGPSGERGLELAANPLAFLQSTFDTYGGIATVVIGGERVVLVGDPVIAKTIVEDEPQKWLKEGTAFFPGSSLAGNGLLVSDGDTWRRQRRLSNPAFRSASVLPPPHAPILRYTPVSVSRGNHLITSRRQRTCSLHEVHWQVAIPLENLAGSFQLSMHLAMQLQ